jgi:hypothetical protein
VKPGYLPSLIEQTLSAVGRIIQQERGVSKFSFTSRSLVNPFTVGWYTEVEIGIRRTFVGRQEDGEMASMIGVVGVLVVAALAILEARAEAGMWSKCRRTESRRQMQRYISAGKARIR